jgi:hypothetical protein
MHQLLERQMTDDERKRLLDCMPLALSPFQARLFKLTLIGESVGVLLAVIILIWFKKLSAAFVIPAAFGFYAIWWLLHLKSRVLRPLHRSREANHRAWEFRNAIAIAQTVSVHCVESDVVVQVIYDEGTVCLFDVGGNQTYWIDPYFMIPGHPPKDWPNRKFELLKSLTGRKRSAHSVLGSDCVHERPWSSEICLSTTTSSHRQTVSSISHLTPS